MKAKHPRKIFVNLPRGDLKPLGVSGTSTANIFALSADSRAEVDELVNTALVAGRHARGRPDGLRIHVRLGLL